MRLPLALLALALATPTLPSPALADTPTLLPGTMPSLSQGRPSAQRFSPAPVPDPDLRAPRSQRDPNAVEIVPGLTRTNTGRAMAGDGFHPGPPIYALWAREAASRIVQGMEQTA